MLLEYLVTMLSECLACFLDSSINISIVIEVLEIYLTYRLDAGGCYLVQMMERFKFSESD